MNLTLNKTIMPKASQGFSLIEVAVTMVIVALALLGTAGLQIFAMKTNQAGKTRTVAIALSADIAERILSNKASAITGAYVVNVATIPVAGTNCDINPCSPAQLASAQR